MTADELAAGEAPVAGEAAAAAGPGNLVEIQAKLAEGTDRFREARIVRTGCGGADLEREVDLEGIQI